jgi:hypothetical protein
MGLGLGMIGIRANAGFCVDDEGGGVAVGWSDERISEGRDGAEEGLIVTVVSAPGSALGQPWGEGYGKSQEKEPHFKLN